MDIRAQQMEPLVNDSPCSGRCMKDILMAATWVSSRPQCWPDTCEERGGGKGWGGRASNYSAALSWKLLLSWGRDSEQTLPDRRNYPHKAQMTRFFFPHCSQSLTVAQEKSSLGINTTSDFKRCSNWWLSPDSHSSEKVLSWRKIQVVPLHGCHRVSWVKTVWK